MAKKDTKELLKKHHFWVLAGLVPLFVLIAVFTISSSVGEAIENREKDYKTSEQSIAAKLNPKSDKLIEAIQSQVSKVQDKKNELWKQNWERQKALYVWPKTSARLKEVERLGLKFGDPIPSGDSQYAEFQKPEVYLAEFSKDLPNRKASLPNPGMADLIAPTQFKAGWQSVLRHVNAWDERQLTSEQIWLMMEDVWVQRSMLDAIRQVNAQMAEFQRVKYVKNDQVIDDPVSKQPNDPLRRKFRSRIWELELEVANKDNKRVLGGRLINHTDRLQLMGLNNTMVVKVWLQPGKDVVPFEFKIGGEFLPGRGATKADGSPANVMTIVPTDEHIITGDVVEIVKVEQVFDTRTVPVRRIENLALGLTDSRFADKQMKIPNFKAYVEEEQRAAAAAPPPGPGGPGAPKGPTFPPPGGFPGAPGATGPGLRSGGGTVDQVVNGNKKRYIEVTGEVRRMPVGIAVVVDQAYMQDVLLAYANSPLKFQITQVTWTRFRDSLNNGINNPSNPLDPSGGVILSGQGNLSGEFQSDPDRRPGGPRPLPGPAPLPGPGGTGPGGPFGFPGSGGLSTVSESQLTSGLIELDVYGVVSLYEKYAAVEGTDPKAKDAPVRVEPKPKVEPRPDPKVAEPKIEPKAPVGKGGDAPEPKAPGDKAPKDATVPEPKTPKTRRRGR
ncbi:unnamed protein product [Gemmataceae bacterium]|nr:unnamed protein product [Gemmataceae bacterium]VTT97191.1 unnamed protein product [Gemmataceae bacterium]